MPYLASFPRLKIWHAGCSSGEEVYSMAILLKEVGLYDRTTIYATDFNDQILKKAGEGIYLSRQSKTIQETILSQEEQKPSQTTMWQNMIQLLWINP